MKILAPACALTLMAIFPQAFAGQEDFKDGPLIYGYGMTAPAAEATPLPSDARFSVAFDVAEAAESGEVNRKINSAARFLNMHSAAGVPKERLRVALVIHGGAHRDLLNAEALGEPNANAELISELLKNGGQLTLCGQTAAYYGVAAKDLLPGITLSLSAMTAHAQLQQAGFTLNPF